MQAGRLRHRIRIEKPVTIKNPSTGERIQGWELVADKVPAEIVPVSVRDFVAAAQHQSQITARIVVRFRAGITSNMRCTDLSTGAIYNIQAPLADPVSGREYLTFACTTGVNNG